MSPSGHANSTKAILYAFVANLGLAFTKLGAAFYTGSGSLLAEAIHSFADFCRLSRDSFRRGLGRGTHKANRRAKYTPHPD